MSESTMKIFKQLFSTLVLYRHNIHILHWKCHGRDFEAVHMHMDTYLDRFNEFIDDIGEIMMELDMNPLCLCSCMKELEGDQDKKHVCIDADADYDSVMVYRFIESMFCELMDMYKHISYDAAIPSDVKSILDEHSQWLRLETNYKNKRRLFN